MPRPAVDLEPLREEILSLYRNNVPIEEIVSAIEAAGVKVAQRTVERRLQAWGVPPRQQRTVDSEQLRKIIEEEFFPSKPSDEVLLERVRARGFIASLHGIRRLRKELGIYRRRTEEQVHDQLQKAITYAFTPSMTAHETSDLSLRTIQAHFLANAKLFLPRNQTYRLFCQLFPDEAAARFSKFRRRKGGFTLPGPNHTWSIDGYCKLQRFGFEVYAAIDAYSRYIIWSYVGVSALTSRSVFIQYLLAINHFGFMPMVLRSDRGVETTMAAAAHYFLALTTLTQRRIVPRRARNGEIEWVMRPGDGSPLIRVDLDNPSQAAQEAFETLPLGDLEFSDCFIYGKSTGNQRIEQWWSMLKIGKTTKWLVSWKSLR